MVEPQKTEKTPTKATRRDMERPRSSNAEVDAFLEQIRSLAPAASGRGRLLFAMDATMSRQPTWDRAIQRQGEMFAAVERIGTLDVQLAYFRGFGECRASKWVSDAADLRGLMERIDCRGGQTQIGKVLTHALKENRKRPISAVAYVGDANNVAFSLALGAGLAQMEFRIASPVGYGFDEADLARISVVGEPRVYDSPVAAVEGADAVYTDAWTSMGQEAEASKRTRDFEGFQIDEKMMASAADESIFLHCLPAHRGEEVTDAVLDGPSSRIWPQAANRMHAARGLLVWLLGEANR